MGKKILIAAANYWTSPYQVGSHHYARIFAENGWEVMFISDPISPFHFLLKEKAQVHERYRIYKGRAGTGWDNIKTYVPFSLFTPNEKPFFRSSFVINNWHKFTIPGLVKHVKESGFGGIDLLWFDSIIQHFWIDSINFKKSVLRISDVMDAFKKNTPNVKILEEKLKNKVDNIIYTSKTLKTYFKGYEDKAVFVPNGVDFKHYEYSGKDVPQDFADIPRPIAIYVGAIEEWFGVDFFAEVAAGNPGISFVIIGEPGINISNLKKLSNIFFLGRKKYTDVPAYLYNSDAGIIIFDAKHPVVRSINPIKLYEYMACGLPVVATVWDELVELGSPAFLAGDPADFSEKLKIAIKDKNNKAYVEFAKNNSWCSRFKSINSEILSGK